MKKLYPGVAQPLMPAAIVLGFFAGAAVPVRAQNPELQQRLADLKQSIAQNKQQLATYTWVEQVTISL